MTEYVAAGYMTRFRCLGSSCEDTCCKAWEVKITESDYMRLAGALGERADKLVTKIPDGHGGSLTVLRKLPDRACPELDANHLCSVHARFGEEALPDTCASYPRVIGRLGDRLELTAHMSCPEVARMCLLADDSALVPATPDVFGRANPRLTLARDGAKPYFAAFELVRDAIIALCVDTTNGFPFSSRLYFVAELATRLAPFYHRDATVAEPDRLAHELAEIRRPEVQAELHAKRVASDPMEGLCLQSVIGMIAARCDAAPAFATVVKKLASTHAAAAKHADARPPVPLLVAIGPEALWGTHSERRPKARSAHGARTDRYLARLSRTYWLQDWYPVSETLLEHVMHLALRVALVRFLLVGHPEFGADVDDATCDRAAVEVIYATSRVYDHNADVRAALSETLNKRGMLTVGHCAAILML